MTEYANEVNPLSPTLTFQLLGSSPFGSDPSFLKRDVQLLPIDTNEQTVRYSSIELLNTLGDGFRNDEYFDTVNPRLQVELKSAWRNVQIPDANSQSTQIKLLIRKGVPDDLRQTVWKALSGWTEASKEYPNLYSDALVRAFGAKPPTLFRSYPLFGGLISPSDHFLIGEADELVKRLLVVIGLEFPAVDYCPCIPDLVQILLTFLGEADTFGVVWSMLKRPQDARKYILVSKHDHEMFYVSFLKVLAKHLPKLHKHVVALSIPHKESYNFIANWFSRLFVSSFPYQAVLHIFDAFMNEGVKVMFRFALSALEQHKDALMRTTTAKEFRHVLNSHTCTCVKECDALIKRAFTYPLKRKDMEMDFVQSTQVEDSLPVFYRPKIAQPSTIIEDDKFEILWSWISHRLCIRDPLLVYSAEKHGWSLQTIAYRCKNEAPLLLLIKSDSGAVFGAFMSDPPSPSRTEYYGDRECFLYTLTPHTSCYRWTMKNDLFIRCHADYISMGSGGHGYGLYIHQDMWGRTDACETFDNPPLDEVKPDHFQILALEIYAFR